MIPKIIVVLEQIKQVRKKKTSRLQFGIAQLFITTELRFLSYLSYQSATQTWEKVGVRKRSHGF
jgi:hypothetical protein